MPSILLPHAQRHAHSSIWDRLSGPGINFRPKKTRFNNGRHAHPNVPTDQTRHLVSNAADAIIKAKVLEAQAAAMRAQAAALAAAETTAFPHNSAMRKTAHAASQALSASTESGAAVDTQCVDTSPKPPPTVKLYNPQKLLTQVTAFP
ncbi:hypothetical protein FRX31_028407 [Thalictrum thalictroides]|uniref:Uncharacterized protein n=1 Tax=Thalictrum thalictroides TaxID=46969 RepID=A0A7J6VB88_THATH|nr:hypothetical protein FRX31_028407 [Thalictrum thalictroides]